MIILPLLLAVLGCGPDPVQTPDQKAVLSVLTRFQEAKNNRDLEALMPLLHDDGQFSFACGIMVSKTELAQRIPGFWAEMDGQKLGVVPLAHECLNGDYYRAGVLKEPVITISGTKASARVLFTQRLWSSLLLFVSLKKEAEEWRITRFEWGPS